MSLMAALLTILTYPYGVYSNIEFTISAASLAGEIVEGSHWVLVVVACHAF